jgi:hypothetical protein
MIQKLTSAGMMLLLFLSATEILQAEMKDRPFWMGPDNSGVQTRPYWAGDAFIPPFPERSPRRPDIEIEEPWTDLTAPRNEGGGEIPTIRHFSPDLLKQQARMLEDRCRALDPTDPCTIGSHRTPLSP